MKDSVQYHILAMLWMIFASVTDLRNGSDVFVVMGIIIGIVYWGVAIYTSWSED